MNGYMDSVIVSFLRNQYPSALNIYKEDRDTWRVCIAEDFEPAFRYRDGALSHVEQECMVFN